MHELDCKDSFRSRQEFRVYSQLPGVHQVLLFVGRFSSAGTFMLTRLNDHVCYPLFEVYWNLYCYAPTRYGHVAAAQRARACVCAQDPCVLLPLALINMIGVEIYAEAIVNILKSEIEHHIA